jgi:hypothetical protein
MIRAYKPFRDLRKWIEIRISVTKTKGMLEILINIVDLGFLFEVFFGKWNNFVGL